MQIGGLCPDAALGGWHAHDVANDMGDFLGSEPDAFLDKPIEPFLLRQTVNRLLEQTYT